MAAQNTIKIDGMRSIVRGLSKIDSRIRNRTIGSAIKKASKPLVMETKARAPVESGLLRASIGTTFKVNKRKGIGVAKTGPRNMKGSKRQAKGSTAAKRSRNPVHYAYLIEFGTKPHKVPYTLVGGGGFRKVVPIPFDHPGTPPNPFMRRAFISARARVMGSLSTELKAAIRKAASKSRSKK